MATTRVEYPIPMAENIMGNMEEVGLPITVKRSLGIYHTLNGNVSVAAYECFSTETAIHTDNEISKYFWATRDELIPENDAYKFRGHIVFGLTYRILYDYFYSNP